MRLKTDLENFQMLKELKEERDKLRAEIADLEQDASDLKGFLADVEEDIEFLEKEEL